MNSTLKYVGLLAVLPLLTVALTTDYIIEADAKKSEGANAPGRVGVKSYGSSTANVVCGDRLCSETGGRTEISSAPAAPVTEEKTTEDKTMETKGAPGSVLRLSLANVEATIPLHQGYYEGEEVFFIITDSSDKVHADEITSKQGWKVELAPLLANAPDAALSKTYLFKNGIKGNGVHGYQTEVFTSTPAQPNVYSGLSSVVHVTWNDDSAKILKSEADIMAAESEGRVSLEETNVVLNTPQIVWPGGQMQINEDATLSHDMPYGGGQVLDINTDEMSVTFIAHRGWGPDGETIYYIVTDATPSGPAQMMGVVNAPTSASLIANSAAVDLFQFANGIKGPGPVGFQPGIAASVPGDKNYSPMWRIFMINWEDPNNALLLETRSDIDHFQSEGLISVGLARPMDSDHIVNCPFIDPFQ